MPAPPLLQLHGRSTVPGLDAPLGETWSAMINTSPCNHVPFRNTGSLRTPEALRLMPLAISVGANRPAANVVVVVIGSAHLRHSRFLLAFYGNPSDALSTPAPRHLLTATTHKYQAAVSYGPGSQTTILRNGSPILWLEYLQSSLARRTTPPTPLPPDTTTSKLQFPEPRTSPTSETPCGRTSLRQTICTPSPPANWHTNSLPITRVERGIRSTPQGDRFLTCRSHPLEFGSHTSLSTQQQSLFLIFVRVPAVS